MSKTAAVVKTKEPLGQTELTSVQDKQIASLGTVSARIRYLDKEGYTRSEISRAIPNAKGGKLRYQHVRNVLEAPAPKQS